MECDAEGPFIEGNAEDDDIWPKARAAWNRRAHPAVKALTWIPDHGVAALGPYRLFQAETPLGRFCYGTDAEGAAYWQNNKTGVFMVGDEQTARRQAEAAWTKAACAEASKFVALSALVSAPADPATAPAWNGWRSIDTAPEDQHVILATSGGFVGEAIMLRDEATGAQKWAWALGPVHENHRPYGWKPLPEPLFAPVLSDLRPDGFDGPTGAE